MINRIRRIPFLSVLSRFALFRDDDWFKGLWMRPVRREMKDAPEIRIDYLSVNDEGYTVRAEIPGAKKENVKVRVDGNRISISAEVKLDIEEGNGDKIICSECFRGSSYRSFTLDGDVDEDKAEAKYDNGVLELILPRKNAGVARELRVK